MIEATLNNADRFEPGRRTLIVLIIVVLVALSNCQSLSSTEVSHVTTKQSGPELTDRCYIINSVFFRDLTVLPLALTPVVVSMLETPGLLLLDTAVDQRKLQT